MDTQDHEIFHSLTEKALGAVFEVSNTLGAGFLEKVYQRALLIELRLRGLHAEPEVAFPVIYKGNTVGEYFADILVNQRLVIELKCADTLSPAHTAQCLNYLKASNQNLCLLINFQKSKVEWKRIIL
jgi:GxxExxY protein